MAYINHNGAITQPS